MTTDRPLVGKITSQFTNDDTGELAFKVELGIETTLTGTARATSITITMHEGYSVNSELLSELSQVIGILTDQGAAFLQTKALEASLPKVAPGGTITYGIGDKTFEFEVGEDGVARSTFGTNDALRDIKLGVAESFTEETFAELQRRRRSRLSDDDYERVARVYREARSRGEGAQRAVASDFTVTVARARQLIREARNRGLLPETTKGKAT